MPKSQHSHTTLAPHLQAVLDQAMRERTPECPAHEDAYLAVNLTRAGVPMNAIATAMGVDVETVRRWKVYVQSDADVRAASEDGTISFTSAVEIASLKNSQTQREILAQVLLRQEDLKRQGQLPSDGLPSKEVQRMVRVERKGEPERARPKVRTVKWVLEANGKRLRGTLPEAVVAAFKWFVGLGPSSRVPGLDAILSG